MEQAVTAAVLALGDAPTTAPLPWHFVVKAAITMQTSVCVALRLIAERIRRKEVFRTLAMAHVCDLLQGLAAGLRRYLSPIDGDWQLGVVVEDEVSPDDIPSVVVMSPALVAATLVCGAELRDCKISKLPQFMYGRGSDDENQVCCARHAGHNTQHRALSSGTLCAV